MKRWMIVVAVLAGCRLETPEVPPLAVEYSGCTSVLAGPVCEVQPEVRLTLWLADEAQPTAVELRLDGEPLAAQEVAPVGGGQRHTVAVRPGVLTVQRGDAQWRLLIGADSRPPLLAEVEVQRRQDPAAALARLQAAQPGDKVSRGLVELMRGKVLRQLGRLDEALEALKGAEVALAKAGHWSGSTNAAEVAAFVLTDVLYRFHEAEEVFAPHPANGDLWPEGRARVAFYQAGIACGVGDHRRCFRLLDEAAVRAERLGLAALQDSTRTLQARTLGGLGNHAEALAILEAAVASLANQSPCNVAVAHNNLTLAREAADQDWPAVEQAARVALTQAQACQDPETSALVALTVAEVALARKRPEQARAALRGVPAGLPSTRWRLWNQVLNGTLALEEQRWSEALPAFAEAQAEASRLGLAVLAHSARVGEARALSGLGRVEDALVAFGRADEAVTAVLAAVPVGAEREAFVGDRDEGLRHHLALLISLGRVSEALDLSRKSRARALASLQLADRIDSLDAPRRRRWQEAIGAYRQQKALLEVDDWSATAEERARRAAARPAAEEALRRRLDDVWAVVGAVPQVDRPRPVEPGEVLLHYRSGIPATGCEAERASQGVGCGSPGGWWAFRQSAAGVEVVEIADPLAASSEAERAERLLGPFAEAIRGAQRIRFVVSGPLAGLDLHGLPFDGAPLGERRPVVYGVDVPGPSQAPGVGALVVADPRGDLAGARRSGEAAATSLAARLLRGEDARREAVLSGLGQAELFIYAGHGALAGDGWASHLRLAGEDQLVPGDLLLQPRLPRRVVLAGCETGRAPARSVAMGMSLAHAFVVGGAEAVVATTRPVADDDAARLLEALQGELPQEDDLARALLRALARVSEPMDRTAWRVVVR